MREARNAWDWTRAGGNEWIVRRRIEPWEILAAAEALDKTLALLDTPPPRDTASGLAAIVPHIVQYAQVKLCLRHTSHLVGLINPAPIALDPTARDLAEPISRIIGRTVNKGQNPNDGSGEPLLPVLHELVAAVRARCDAHA